MSDADRAGRDDTAGRDPPARREREIIDIVDRLGAASVAQVLEQMTEPPSSSTVRTLMGTLVKKGQRTHTVSGPRLLTPDLLTRRSGKGPRARRWGAPPSMAIRGC